MEHDEYFQNNVSERLINSSVLKSTTASTIGRPLRRTAWRWVALFLVNLLVLGDFVAIDNPQPLETQIEEILQIDQQTYSLLYSSWAIPSIVIPFFGGYLTDKLGVRPALLVFGAAITIGQFVYAYGGYLKDFGWMLAGRAIYAIGSDPLNVAQIVVTNKWFQGNEVGLAMALGSTTCGVARAINSYLIPQIFEWSQDLFTPMLFSAIMCILAMVATVLMVILDRANDQRELRSEEKLHLLTEEEKISIKDLKHFKAIVWLLIVNFALTNAVFFSFNVFTNDLYHVQFNFSNTAAGTIISINFIITAISSTIFGKIVDTYGYRASMILVTSVLTVIGFIYFVAVPECNECLSTIIPQVFFGLGIGINDAAIFPSLPLVLEEKYLGTGYGLFFVLQNILVLILPIFGAMIKEQFGGYYAMSLFFGAWSVLTIFESVALFLQDRKHGKVLEELVPEEDEDEEEYEECDEESPSKDSSSSSGSQSEPGRNEILALNS